MELQAGFTAVSIAIIRLATDAFKGIRLGD